jgi:hypothetical protein
VSQPEIVGSEIEVPRSEPSPRRRRRIEARSSSRVSTRRVRRLRLHAVYFSLAAIWGFLAGTGAVLVGLAAVGRPTRLGPGATLLVGCAAILALLGGLVAAAAYRAASRRHR